ncbi:uncharacterized protein EI90DRAFT_3036693 [Cantharellus anzutake]|uniref:uncharacterized protein n=1 Tax=Cantharellus anzutake TaxID=1750568 RepID=UPI001906CD62|nr:uncharacterized protein EI90DRAFT_3036693 [Cantharellus anzutake]KAF8340734.1 hypothetical protein EI90DRAFT_3036693 [Cantharellus anzutake]
MMVSPEDPTELTNLDPNIIETTADERADKLDDTIHSIINPFEKAKSFYTDNSDVIHATVQLFTGDSAAGKLVDGWLGTIDRVVNGLDELAKSQPFPFVGPAILVFTALVKLESQRRENSKRARALLLQIADMLSALLQLHFVKDPELKDADGQSVQGRIQVLMEDIKKDIQDCGNLIHTYHNHSLTSKFFFSGSYAAQFNAKASLLVNRKSDIIFALQIHNTVNIDAIRAEVTDTNVMLKELIAVVSHKSERHIRCEQAVNDLGGRKKVLGNDELLTSMATMIQVGAKGDEKTVQSVTAALQGPLGAGASLSRDEGVLSAQERHELRLPLDTILAQNAKYFSKKLGVQVDVIANQLDKVRQSTTQILHSIGGASYQRIVNPVVRRIWKEMGWHTNVKARIFVMTLHDYYQDMFSSSSAVPTGGAGGEVAVGGEDDAKPSDPSEEADCLDYTPDPANKWCLQFLNLRYLSSIMEAFDDDSSGFVRISEVNDFTASIPKGWSLLQWLAYWAHGWRVEASIYAQLMHALLNQMYELTNTVHLMNSRIIHVYFHGHWVPKLDRLLKRAMYSTWNVTSTPLDDLVLVQMEERRKRLMPALQRLYFNIDDAESLGLIKEPGRIEKDLFAILYLVLLRHASMIKLGKTVILDDREFTEASKTLNCIFSAIDDRLSNLDEALKGRGVDPAPFIARYAGGVYEFLYQGNVPDNLGGIVNDDAVEAAAAIFEKSNIDVKDLQFGEWHLDTSGYEKVPEPEAEPDRDDITSPVLLEAPVLVPGASVNVEAYVRQVVSRLEHLATHEQFKFVKPSVNMLKSIANAEFDRWLKSDVPRTLIAQMADMLDTLLHLRHMENLELVTDTAVTTMCRVQDLVRRIEKDLRDCKHLIRMYHKINVSREEPITLYFRQRAEGLLRRKNDLIDAMSRSDIQGIARFRALGYTVVRQVKEMRQRLKWEFYRDRRDTRNGYVSLVAKQLQCAETRAIRHVAVSMTAEEEERLRDLSDDLSEADWAYYQSLAKLKYRLTRAHLNLICYNCPKVLIVGKAYQCLSCTSVVLCEKCEQKSPSGISDATGKMHLSSHPLLQISRPVVQITKTELEGIVRMYERLANGAQDSDGSDSDVQWSDEENDPESHNEDLDSRSAWSFSAIEKLPQGRLHSLSVASSSVVESPAELTRQMIWEDAATKDEHISDLEDEGFYKCSHCHELYTGVRFVMIKQYRGKYLCPDCERELSARHENEPLPAYLLLLLKCTLPVVETPILKGGALEDIQSLQPRDERAQNIEDQLQKVEERLNLLLGLLNGQNRPTRALMPN